MDQKFKQAFEQLLKYEGEYSNHPNDSGGKTKYGITESLARESSYKGDMKDLTKDKAAEIYYNKFWTKYRYNKIKNEKISFECFEQAVNLGPTYANEHLQEAYNLLAKDDLIVDGIIGPRTLNAINNLDLKDYDYILKLLNIMQGNRYIKIVQSDNSQNVFIRGWLKRVRFINNSDKSNDKRINSGEENDVKNSGIMKAIVIILGSGIILAILKFIL